jgi:hypothetical protein
MKKTRGDEPFGVVTHICRATAQVNSLCNYFYFKLAKKSCFSFYLLSCFFYKIKEQEGGTGSGKDGWGVVTSRRGKVLGKGGRRVNTVQIMCIHVRK